MDSSYSSSPSLPSASSPNRKYLIGGVSFALCLCVTVGVATYLTVHNNNSSESSTNTISRLGEESVPDLLADIKKELLETKAQVKILSDLMKEDLTMCKRTAESTYVPSGPALTFSQDPFWTYIMDDSHSIVTKLPSAYPDKWYSSYAVGSLLPSENIFTFKFKILDLGITNFPTIMVGVAPHKILELPGPTEEHRDFKSDMHTRHGWWISCSDLSLWSGPPTNFTDQEYINPAGRTCSQRALALGSIIAVTVDRTKSTISFAIDGEDCGVAYRGVVEPQLYPVVTLRNPNQSVKLMW
jgi:hypothetical protein